MSQTSGHGGHDPDRDDWLKKFSGLPEATTDDELFNDRIAREPVQQRRADPMTIEGEIASFGEVARESKRIFLDSDSDPKRRAMSGISFLLVMTPIVGIIAAVIISLVAGLWSL